MKGLFIVIDGTDGSGKGTQTKRLATRLEQEDIPFYVADFPRYGNTSAYFVEKYLRGEYGQAHEISAKRASLFYALDRHDAAAEIQQALDAGKIVISNRYVSANKGHQAGKIADLEERRQFIDWLNELEYTILRIPRPDLTILLHVPADIGYQLVASKDERGYLDGKKRDIHEADPEHLRNAEQAYLSLPQIDQGEQWQILECVEQEQLLPIEDIHERLWQIIQPLIRPAQPIN